MVHEPVQQDTDVALGLLGVDPKLLQRISADLPLDADSPGAGPGWQDVSELRATPGQISLLRLLAEHERCMRQELAEHPAVAPSTGRAMVSCRQARGEVD